MKKFIIVFLLFNSFVLLFSQIPNIDGEFYNAEKLFFQRKYNLSREAFLLYLKRRPLSTNDMLYYYIGACYFQDKQYQNAIDYYKLAFDIKDSYSYCNNIANSYYQLKNYEEALIWYNRSIERLYSPYLVKLNEEILTNYAISQNIVTNTVLAYTLNENLNENSEYNFEENLENSEDLENFENISEDLPDNIENLENNLDLYDLYNEDFNINTNERDKRDKRNKFYNSFTKLPIFTNIVITNTFTNEYSFTNKTVLFEENDNFDLEIVNGVNEIENNDSSSSNSINSINTNSISENFSITNIIITSNIVNNGETIEIKTNAASIDSFNTWALYYSAYLNMGHTYLALGDLTNAALSYQIFLTNIEKFENDYYQKESLEKVISLIRNNDNFIEFIPFTNNHRISENNDGSSTTETIYPNFDYKRETVFEKGVRIVYESGKFEKIKMYSNNYEISDTIYPYGKREIETVFENGDKKIESYFADNSKSLNIKTKDGNIYEYILYQDGSFIERNIKNNGESVTEIKKTDGSLIVKTENADGSYKIAANYIDGSIGTATVDKEGKSNLKIVYPDGRVEERNSNNAGEGTFSYNVKTDDGSVITKTYNEDGSFTVITKKSDGTMITDIIAEVSISEIKLPDGTLITRIIREDGSKETTTLNKDSSSITEIADLNGIMLKAVDSEGYILEMRRFENEEAEITLFDSFGNQVDLETAKIAIKRMNLNIKAEDIDNLILLEEDEEYNELENLDDINNADSEEAYYIKENSDNIEE